MALAAAGLTPEQLAAQIGIDLKTAQRWISTDRVPHRRHRWATCELLRVDETYLWPAVMEDRRSRSASESELLTIYPNRGAVPRDVWLGLIDRAREAIDILVYAALFLWDGFPDLPLLLAQKAREGADMRLLLGDPDSQSVLSRGAEEGIDGGLAARIRISLTYLAPIASTPGVELRLHDTTLYNSLYRFDNDLLVNTHAYERLQPNRPFFTSAD